MVAGLLPSADAYMANREWGSLMTMLLIAYMGGLKRDSLSFHCQFLVATIVGWRPACYISFPHNPVNVWGCHISLSQKSLSLFLVHSVKLAVCNKQKRRHCYWHCSFYATKFACNTNLILPESLYIYIYIYMHTYINCWHSTLKTCRTEVSHFSLYPCSTCQTKSGFLSARTS